jgi:hypothetical protein
VGSQVPPYSHFTRIVLFVLTKFIQYPAWCHSLLSHVVIILPAISCIHPVQSFQEKVIPDRADDHFSLEVLTPMDGVNLSMGN